MDPVTICNMALGNLGDLGKFKRMASMSRAALTHDHHHVLLDFYEESKLQMHAAMDWARTRKVKALTVHADAPLLDGYWTYKYARPPDCAIFRKLIDKSNREYQYEEMNEENPTEKNVEWIYANVADALGWYTILIGEERYMPGMAELQAIILAQKVAMTIVARAETRLAFTQEMRVRARECMALAAQEGYVEKEKGEREYTDLF